MLRFPMLIKKNALLPASGGRTYEKNSNTAGQDVKQPFKKITKYTSDGKPIINQEENYE
jgi:hypothetical protein